MNPKPAVTTPHTVAEINLDRPLSLVLKDIEARYFSHVMTAANGNKAEAARRAGMNDATFRKRIAGYTVRTVFTLG